MKILYYWKLLFLGISFLVHSSTSSETLKPYNNDGICDDGGDCSPTNDNQAQRESVQNSDGGGTCFKAIDTSISGTPYKLFDQNDSPQYNHVSIINDVCDCSQNVKERKHAVVRKEVDGKVTLVDVYVSCGEQETEPENLLLDYLKQIPERALGEQPGIDENDDNVCLDDEGFISPSLPGENKISCFSHVIAISNGSYSEDKLLQGSVHYYSGRYSVNRIDQNKNLDHEGKNFSMIALFDELGFGCNATELGDENDNHCHTFFNSFTYSIMCCCLAKPGQCSLRKYGQDKQICGMGEYQFNFNHSLEIQAVPTNRTIDVTSLKRNVLREYCTSQYTFDKSMIYYAMPNPSSNFSCMSNKDSSGFCVLDTDVCPSSDHNPASTNVSCCCYKPDLCNLDFVQIKAVDRFEMMIKNKVCEQPMLYSILFTTTNYTLEGDDRQPLCYIHYDVNNPTARYFLANNNLDLLRDEDYKAYRKEGCHVIAGKLRSTITSKCPNEKYTDEDTKLPRPLLLCTCKGAKVGEVTTKQTKFCDEDLRKNIGNNYAELEKNLMPKCLVSETAYHNFAENVAFDSFSKLGSIKLAKKSVFCYMELSKSDNENANGLGQFSLSAGIASLENDYGKECYDLYNLEETKKEEAYCTGEQNGKIVCCLFTLGNYSMELYEKMKEKVVEYQVLDNSSIIEKLYKSQQTLECQSSRHMREFGKCKHPHGCFWSDYSTGEVKTTYVAGCIEKLPKLLEKNPSNPLFRALQTCVTISKLRKQSHATEAEKLNEPFRCFATNEINLPDEKDQLTNVYIVCCCTEIDENGTCKRKDYTKSIYGAKVSEVGNNQLQHQSKDHIYQIPF